METKSAAWFERYNRYLQTEQWQRVRKAVFERDEGRCTNCRRQLTLEEMECHHIFYSGFNRFGHSQPDECITLCKKCHAEMHPHLQEEESAVNRVLKSLRKKKT